MSATYPDGYLLQIGAFSCPWEGCPILTDDADEIEAHVRWHDAENGYVGDDLAEDFTGTGRYQP